MTEHSSERFKLQQHEDGQIYITEGSEQMLHAEIRGPHDVEIQLGHTGRVKIDKLYGPLVMWPIRVTIDFEACEWVVERSYGPEGEWREVTRVPGQIDSDFSEESR